MRVWNETNAIQSNTERNPTERKNLTSRKIKAVPQVETDRTGKENDLVSNTTLLLMEWASDCGEEFLDG
jgi:hypothetical protein